MAKRLERNNDLESTQEISVEEIQKANEEYDIPSFVQSQHLDDDEEQEECEELESTPSIKIAIYILIAFVTAIIVIVGFNIVSSSNTSTNKETEAVATTTPDATENTEVELDYFYKQNALTAINSKLTELYEADGYTKPSSEQITLSGTQNNLVAKFDVTVGTAYKKNYVMPAEFNLTWDDELNSYYVSSYTIDDSEAVKSGFKTHTSKKEAEKTAKESANTEGSEVSNFEVTVRNSVTVTITGKGSGTVTAYAISEDGTTTELASVSGGTTTKTVSLESGQYKLVLYATENAGYSWNYQLG